MLTIIPAYGRDYKTAAAAKADWRDGKDFVVADMFNPYDGKPINRADAESAGIKVMIRYKGLTQVTRP